MKQSRRIQLVLLLAAVLACAIGNLILLRDTRTDDDNNNSVWASFLAPNPSSSSSIQDKDAALTAYQESHKSLMDCHTQLQVYKNGKIQECLQARLPLLEAVLQQRDDQYSILMLWTHLQDFKDDWKDTIWYLSLIHI